MVLNASAADERLTRLPDGFEGPRACGPYDLASALDLINLVLRTLGTPAGAPTRWPTIGFDYTHIYNFDNLRNVRVILKDGWVVSSVGIYPNIVHTPRGTVSVGGINGVVTHPDFQRLGFASLLLEDAHATMRADGRHVGLLHTDITNFYRKLGWETAGSQLTFVFDRGNVPFLPDPDGLDVIDEWRPHTEELRRLHNADCFGARRSNELFTLLATRKLSRIWVARRHGRIVAYSGLRGTSVHEYAGESRDVAALLRAAFAQIDDLGAKTSERPPGLRPTIEMTITTPAIAEGLPGYLRSLGIPYTVAYIGMIKILDAPSLLAALGLREVELQPLGSGWRLRRGDQTCDVTEREFVKLVFGPERPRDFAPDLFPVPFYQWKLERV